MEDTFGMQGYTCNGCGYDKSRCICSFDPPAEFLLPIEMDNADDIFDGPKWYEDDYYDDWQNGYDADDELRAEAADSACRDCGHYTCRCDEYDYVDADPIEATLDFEEHFAPENFHKFKVILKRPARVQHLPAKVAADAMDAVEDEKRTVRDVSWKRMNRKARKGWERHPHRLMCINNEVMERATREGERSIDYGFKRDLEMRKRRTYNRIMERLHGRGGNKAMMVRVIHLPRLLEAA